MASTKQHAAIDFQGAAKITIAGAAGTDGQVLTSGGSGAMTWENAGSGGGSGTVSSGEQYEVPYYASTGTTVDDSGFLAIKPLQYEVLVGDGTNGELNVGGTWGQSSSTNRLYVKGMILADGLIDKDDATKFIKPASTSPAIKIGGSIQMAALSSEYSASGYGSLYAGSNTMPYWVDGSSYTYTVYTSSDYRLKKNVALCDPSEASALIKELPVYTFNWNEDGKKLAVGDKDASQLGFLAHEVKEKIPYNTLVQQEKDAVNEDGSPYHQILDQQNMVPILWSALQDALKRIEVLEGQ